MYTKRHTIQSISYSEPNAFSMRARSRAFIPNRIWHTQWSIASVVDTQIHDNLEGYANDVDSAYVSLWLDPRRTCTRNVCTELWFDMKQVSRMCFGTDDATYKKKKKQHQLFESFESMTLRDLHPSPSALHLFTKHSGTLHTIDRNHRPRMYGQMAHALIHVLLMHTLRSRPVQIRIYEAHYARNTRPKKTHMCTHLRENETRTHTKVMCTVCVYVRTPTWRDCVVIY